MNNRDIILPPFSKWSLVLFLVLFSFGSPVFKLVKNITDNQTLPVVVVLIAPSIIIVGYLLSIILGLYHIKRVKFPLIWVFLSILQIFAVTYGAIREYSFMKNFGSTKIIGYEVLNSMQDLGCLITDYEAPTQITSIFYKSPAEQSGLINGDIIVSIEGIKVKSKDEISRVYNGISNHKIHLEIKRNDEMKSIYLEK